MCEIPSGEFWAKVISVDNTVKGNVYAIGKRYLFRLGKDTWHRGLVTSGSPLEYLKSEDPDEELPNIIVSSLDVSRGNVLNE